MNETETRDGPVESFPWPTRLAAHVVMPGTAPRLHGYDVQEDIARHYSFSDTVYLALTGSLPTPENSHRFGVALVFLSPCSVAEAPTHAAVLARLCVAKAAGVLQVGAIGLAEQAGFLAHDLEEVRVWLADTGGVFPAAHVADTPEERAAVERFRLALGPGAGTVPGLDQDPTLLAALFCALFASGLTTHAQWTTVFVVARLPVVAAEAFAATPGDFRGYPMDLPHFEYTGGKDG
jgi:hypothetical protein